MALINCRDCGKSVSTLAAACPHCGVSQGGSLKSVGAFKSAKTGPSRLVIFGGGFVVLFAVFAQFHGRQQATPPTVREKSRSVSAPNTAVVAAVPAGECAGAPEALFPLGTPVTFEMKEKVIEQCPAAKVQQDGNILVSWRGSPYVLVVEAKKGAGPIEFEVSAIRHP